MFCISDFFGNISGIHFSKDTFKNKQVIFCVIGIIIIGYTNHSDMVLWQNKFHILTHQNIVPSESAHILYNNGFDNTVFYIFHHTLKIRSVKVCPCISVIHIVPQIEITVIFRIFFQQCFLMRNTCVFRFLSVIS